ncbi:MAG: glycosyltransferase [Bacteriovorax sp.]|nr:glycosyltransferase [Bacteriovorax sp.]
MPFVSVIIPTFNRSSVIIRAINSVLNQNNKDFELIVVDDGSTDETELILSPFIESGKIKYFKHHNRGVSAARNLGVAKASGEWLAFLDSDDEWLPNKLQEQIDYLHQNSTLNIIYGQEIWLRNGKRVNQRAIHQKFGGWIFEKCIQQCLIAPSSVIIKASLFHEMGGFDQEFIVCEDYDLWLKISSLYEVGYISNPIIIKHGGHDDQLSTKYVAMDMWRLRSLSRILMIRNLSAEDKENVIETIKRKGSILKQGYLKHENAKGFEEVEKILQQINY